MMQKRTALWNRNLQLLHKPGLTQETTCTIVTVYQKNEGCRPLFPGFDSILAKPCILFQQEVF